MMMVVAGSLSQLFRCVYVNGVHGYMEGLSVICPTQKGRALRAEFVCTVNNKHK